MLDLKIRTTVASHDSFSAQNQTQKTTNEIPNTFVKIPENFNPTDEDQIKGVFGEKSFTDQIYNNLPDLLKNPCLKLYDDIEREVFFAGALGVVSGMLPNVKGYYDNWISRAN